MAILMISGSRKTTENILQYTYDVVDRSIANGFDIVVGDAMGVDSAVVWRCLEKEYDEFTVYGTKTTPRNEAPTTNYKLFQAIEGQGDGRNYTDRDRFMVDMADRVMCIWNGESKGTIAVAEYARKSNKQFWLFGLYGDSPKVVDLTSRLDEILEWMATK